MNYLNVEDRSQMNDQATDDMLEDFAYEVMNDLTYNAYRWQRWFYGLAPERLAKIFPRADKYEARYQEEQQRAA